MKREFCLLMLYNEASFQFLRSFPAEMISPTCLISYPKAEDILQRDFARLRDEIRAELIEITKRDDSIDIRLRDFSSERISSSFRKFSNIFSQSILRRRIS